MEMLWIFLQVFAILSVIGIVSYLVSRLADRLGIKIGDDDD